MTGKRYISLIAQTKNEVAPKLEQVEILKREVQGKATYEIQLDTELQKRILEV